MMDRDGMEVKSNEEEEKEEEECVMGDVPRWKR